MHTATELWRHTTESVLIRHHPYLEGLLVFFHPTTAILSFTQQIVLHFLRHKVLFGCRVSSWEVGLSSSLILKTSTKSEGVIRKDWIWVICNVWRTCKPMQFSCQKCYLTIGVEYQLKLSLSFLTFKIELFKELKRGGGGDHLVLI